MGIDRRWSGDATIRAGIQKFYRCSAVARGEKVIPCSTIWLKSNFFGIIPECNMAYHASHPAQSGGNVNFQAC